MAACIDDWLAQALSGLDPNTLGNYQHAAEHARAKLGRVRLRDLTARHVQKPLDELAQSLSTRYLRLIHQIIERSIAHARAADLVGRNVASLVKTRKGQAGRPSQSLTLADAAAVSWEMRHTFVSLLSANDVSLEDIAQLVAHSGTSVTERVYRHEIRPAPLG